MILDVPLLLTEDGQHFTLTVPGETSATPGLVVVRRIKLFEDPLWQVLHANSGANLGSFIDRDDAFAFARGLSTTGFDWTLARSVLREQVTTQQLQLIKQLRAEHRGYLK